jgi:hypothetical protein
MWHDSSCTHTSSSDKTDWLLTVNVYTLTAYHQQDYSELANFKHHSLSVGVQFMLIDATSQIQLQKPAIRDSLHSATHKNLQSENRSIPQHTKTCNQRLAPFRNTRYVSHMLFDMNRIQKLATI